MPINNNFEKKLKQVLPKIINEFGTPFVLYDAQGIIDEYVNLSECFKDLKYNNFFAVKATPEPVILKLMLDLGSGFDCSSIQELLMVRKLGVKPENIIFTSNNTSKEEFEVAVADGGCILNLDDVSFIDKVPQMPERICFRYNPGSARSGNDIIGDPVESKFGVPDKQIIEVYAQAQKRGAKKFGLHTMICSNELDHEYFVQNTQMLSEVVMRLHKELNIKLDFINIGGGLGIPYGPKDKPVNIAKMTSRIIEVMQDLENIVGYVPDLYTEFGRYMTGPHGVLVMRVENIMNKYRKYVGVDASTNINPRPAIYDTYHKLSVFGKEDDKITEVVDVVGSLCRNNDKLAVERRLPKLEIGDILIQHDVGAHAVSLGYNYNGRLLPQQLLLRQSDVVCIRRKQVPKDMDITLSGGIVGKTVQI